MATYSKWFDDENFKAVCSRNLDTAEVAPVPEPILYKHALERLRERCGQRLANIGTIHMMEHKIQDGKTKLIHSQPDGKNIHEVDWEGGSFFPVYHTQSRNIVTFLDGGMAADFGFGGNNGDSFTVTSNGKTVDGNEYLKARMDEPKPDTPNPISRERKRLLSKEEFIDTVRKNLTISEVATLTGRTYEATLARCKALGVYPSDYSPRTPVKSKPPDHRPSSAPAPVVGLADLDKQEQELMARLERLRADKDRLIDFKRLKISVNGGGHTLHIQKEGEHMTLPSADITDLIEKLTEIATAPAQHGLAMQDIQ